MKLIFSIVNNDDSHSVSSALTQNGFQATKLASTGGFLMAGNTTFLVCSEDSQVDEIIELLKHCSRRRKQYVWRIGLFITRNEEINIFKTNKKGIKFN